MPRSVKLELMDPESLQFSEPVAPNEDQDLGESISAGLRTLRVIDRERSLQQIDVDEDAPVIRRGIETQGDEGMKQMYQLSFQVINITFKSTLPPLLALVLQR